MQRTPAILQKASVSDFMGERVLESVFEIGKQTCLVNKFRRLKMTEFPPEILLRIDPAMAWSKANGKSLPITDAD